MAEHDHGKVGGGGSIPSPSTILSGHQPVYLPGIIVFNKIALSDALMFVGHCDYQHRSWHSHNHIRGATLTVPVVNASGPSINDTEIVDGPWARKHVGSIINAYSKRPYFKDYFPALVRELTFGHRYLADLNVSLMDMLCGWLGINTPKYFSENWNIAGHKTEMLKNMCKAVKATDYLSSPGEGYVIPQELEPYKHHYQVFEHPKYDQGAKFVPNLSVIDLLFNVGPKAWEIVRASGWVGPTTK